MGKYKANNKMVNLNPISSIVTLNVNDLNTPIKKRNMFIWGGVEGWEAKAYNCN